MIATLGRKAPGWPRMTGAYRFLLADKNDKRWAFSGEGGI